MAWLVQSGRLKAWSVVPSVVVQRKKGESDVWEAAAKDDEEGSGSGEREGSKWREGLVDSAFEKAERMGLVLT